MSNSQNKKIDTFDNYVVGKSNRLAFMAAKTVSKYPGEKYNPLWIAGTSGLGKTHLLKAVFHEIHTRDPKTVIEWYTAEELSDMLIKAANTGYLDAFWAKLQLPDVLLVDDMHYLCGKDQTQAEFIRLLHAVVDNGHQAVIASSVEVKDLLPFAAMYRYQFDCSIYVDIQPLEDEECIELVRVKADQARLILSEEAIVYMSHHVGRDSRSIEGVIQRLKAEEVLMGSVIDMEMIREICETR